MNKQALLLTIFLVLVLLFRIQQFGGFKPDYKDPELESIASNFEPMRGFLDSKVSLLLPQPQAGLLSGIVLGVKSGISQELKKALTVTSTIHIAVVSGQNLTLLSGFILSFTSLLGRKKTILLTLGLNLFYALLTGFQVPVIRAALMVGFSSAAGLFGRESDSTKVLIFTALLMLIYNPNWLFSISFQLSFLATAGVVIVAPEILKKLSFLPELIKEDFGVSIAAYLMTLPVLAINFHQISLVGILVNTLILWTIPIIMISGLICILLSLVNLALASLLALIPGVFLTYLLYIVSFFNKPDASIYAYTISPAVWLGYYFILIAIYLYFKKSREEAMEKNH